MIDFFRRRSWNLWGIVVGLNWAHFFDSKDWVWIPCLVLSILLFVHTTPRLPETKP